MKFGFIFATILGLSLLTHAETTYVAECTVKVSGKSETLRLRLDRSGNVINWDKSHLGQVVSGRMFQFFGEDFEVSSAESIKMYKGTNGYSIVELITTADAIKVGFNLITKGGFYDYRDLGSGNGNSRLPLNCTIK